jgi:lipopolysaccharide export LptBFGC system permease protein LptF
MFLEERADRLLNAIYHDKNGVMNIYKFWAEEWNDDDESFKHCKQVTDEMTDQKLIKYADDQRTKITITNFGRYWVTQGGYLIYLREGEKKLKAEREKHIDQITEELKEARLKFTHYRLVTYWWSFAFSIISFFLSLISLYLILVKNK